MNAKTSLLSCLVLACTLALASPLVAAQNSSAVQGQDSEFGTVRTVYSVTVDGQPVSIVGHVILKTMYTDQNTRFFMFAISVQNSPSLSISFDHLIRTDKNAELPCVRPVEGDAHSSLRCFVDLKDMPPVGTEILIEGTLGATHQGTFQVGYNAIAFDYNYMKINMSNGLAAELYAYSDVSVTKTTASSGTGLAGFGNKVPGIGVLGVVGAGVAATLLVGLRRRKA